MDSTSGDGPRPSIALNQNSDVAHHPAQIDVDDERRLAAWASGFEFGFECHVASYRCWSVPHLSVTGFPSGSVAVTSTL